MLSTVDSLAIKCACKAHKAKEKAQNWLRKSESGEVNILVIMILCVIAVFLCIIFKDRMTDIVDMVTGSAQTRIEGIINGTGVLPTP